MLIFGFEINSLEPINQLISSQKQRRMNKYIIGFVHKITFFKMLILKKWKIKKKIFYRNFAPGGSTEFTRIFFLNST